MLIWKEEYETGIGFIDEQHQKLFEIGNRAYELFQNKIYMDKYDKIIDIIHELKDYTVFHFRAEEQFLLKGDYKGFFAHKVEHDDFIKKLEDIDYNRIDQGQNEYIVELLNFVYDWIKEHILVTDMKFSKK
jgi:hemerythrin